MLIIANDELDEEEMYLKRLEGGLFKLQLIDVLIAELVSTDNEALRSRLLRTMDRKDIDVDAVIKSLREYGANIGSGDAADEKAAQEKARIAKLVAALEAQQKEKESAAPKPE